MKTFHCTLALAVLAIASAAHAAEKCEGLERALETKSATLNGRNFQERLRAISDNVPVESKIDCSSLANVYKILSNGVRTGGRKLEDDKPLDRARAQANVDEALQDSAIHAQLDELRSRVPDEDLRLLLEAAIFDAEGFYDARELRLQQLREKLGG